LKTRSLGVERDRGADAAADELLKIMRLAFHPATLEAEAISAFLTARRKIGDHPLLNALYQILEYAAYLERVAERAGR